MWCVGDSVLLGLVRGGLAVRGQTDCAQDASEAREEPVSLWIRRLAKPSLMRQTTGSSLSRHEPTPEGAHFAQSASPPTLPCIILSCTVASSHCDEYMWSDQSLVHSLHNLSAGPLPSPPCSQHAAYSSLDSVLQNFQDVVESTSFSSRFPLHGLVDRGMQIHLVTCMTELSQDGSTI